MLILLISCAMKLKKQSQSQFLQKLYSDIDTSTKCINYRIFSLEFITEKYTYLNFSQNSVFHLQGLEPLITDCPLKNGRWENVERFRGN